MIEWPMSSSTNMQNSNEKFMQNGCAVAMLVIGAFCKLTSLSIVIICTAIHMGLRACCQNRKIVGIFMNTENKGCE